MTDSIDLIQARLAQRKHDRAVRYYGADAGIIGNTHRSDLDRKVAAFQPPAKAPDEAQTDLPLNSPQLLTRALGGASAQASADATKSTAALLRDAIMAHRMDASG